MPTLLKDLRIHEISSVDRGAGEGVQIMMMKRGEPEATGFVGKISAATSALLKSVTSIFQDAEAVNKQTLLSETFGQFQEHLQGAVPDELQKADEAATGAAHTIAKEATMTEEELKKAKDKEHEAKGEKDDAKEEAAESKDEEKREMKKALAVMKRELAVMKMSGKHKDYMEAADMKGDEKDSFADKTADERDEHMDRHPIEKRMPESIRKALAQADEDRKVLKSLQEKDQVATFAKRATDIGLSESHGEVLRKAYAGDVIAVGKLEAIIKGLVEQARTGKVFEEFGKAGAGNGAVTAHDQIVAKAAEYRESMVKLGKKCSPEQAFAKVYTDPANAALKKAHDASEVQKRMGIAA